MIKALKKLAYNISVIHWTFRDYVFLILILVAFYLLQLNNHIIADTRKMMREVNELMRRSIFIEYTADTKWFLMNKYGITEQQVFKGDDIGQSDD